MKHIDETVEQYTASQNQGDYAPAKKKSRRAKAARRYTYLDALRGVVPVPQTSNGSTIFRVLMVGGMVTFMVTVNGIRHTGFAFLAQSHWLYPLMFCIAFLVRTYIAETLVGVLASHTAQKLPVGVKRNIAMTVLNVLCMAPIMCAVATLLLNGAHNYVISYVTTLPIVLPIALTVNYFIVGPVVKLLFNNRISPAGGLQALQALRANIDPLTRLLGF